VARNTSNATDSWSKYGLSSSSLKQKERDVPRSFCFSAPTIPLLRFAELHRQLRLIGLMRLQYRLDSSFSHLFNTLFESSPWP
jgi:hypothetical protein